MKLFICDMYSIEFNYKKVSDENLENAVVYCLGRNLAHRHYHLSRGIVPHD